MQDLDTLLKELCARRASDIHFRAGSSPAGRIDGSIIKMDSPALTPAETENFARQMLKSEYESFEKGREADFAYSIAGLARFRVNAYWQRGSVAIIMRVIEERQIPNFQQLGLPFDVFDQLTSHERGIILVTGPTGSGKTTTLASMIDHINRRDPVNIVTLEDPIEVVHPEYRALISQREIGRDTRTFANALRASMRQDPDIILIGEMRDKETVEAALSAAQTGHLVFSTLHTQDAIRTVNRVIDFFEPHERDVIRQGLGESLVGVISQRLLPRIGGGRVIGMEIMLGTPSVRDCITDPKKTDQIKQLLLEGGDKGMKTFDQHLVELIQNGLVEKEDALASATSPHEVKMMLMRATM